MEELNIELINGIFILVGAVIGASLTGIISWIQAEKIRPKSELRIFTSRPARLIEVDSSVADIVQILVGGEIVPTIYTLDIRITNTGTELLSNGRIQIDFTGHVKVLAIDFTDLPDGALDAFQVEHMNQQYEEYLVNFKFMNPGEELTMKVLLNAKPLTVNATFRQPGVISLIRTDYDPLDAEPLFEIIRQSLILHSYSRLVFPQYRRYLEKLKENGN